MQQTIVCEICGDPFSYDYRRGSLRTICDKPSCKVARRKKYTVLLNEESMKDLTPTKTTCMLVAMYTLEGHRDAHYIAAELNRPVDQIQKILDHNRRSGLLVQFFNMFSNGLFADRYPRGKEIVQCELTLTS